MLTPARLFRRVMSLLTSNKLDADLDDELQFHLEMEIDKRVKAGEDPRSAREAALRVFGGVSRHRDDSRDARGVRAVEEFVQDVRVGSRSLARQVTFSVVAVATLAIGIGATTALWASVYRVLLQPFPYREAERLVTISQQDTRTPGNSGPVAPANFKDLRERARSFDMMAAAQPWSWDWAGPEVPVQISGSLVTADFFPLQGLRPVIGRVFTPDEFTSGRSNVVVLTEALWRTRFGADSSIIGRTLTLDQAPHVVVGVVPNDVMRPFDSDMFAPKPDGHGDYQVRTASWWTVAGRLAPGVSLTQASADVERVTRELASEFPASNRNTTAVVIPLRDAVVGSGRRSLLVLLGAVAFVLLIACVNVANLQLAEAIRRQRELAIRTAIGAGRGRLVRQLLTESLLIAGAGALGGLALAYWGIGVIRANAPPELWLLQQLTFDTPAIVCAATLALASALAVGVMPIVASHRINLSSALSAGRRTGSSAARRRANRVLVVAEFALALVLLVGAGLLLRSLGSLLSMNPGYRADHVAVTNLQAWQYYRTAPERAEFARVALERLGSMPGVTRVGLTSALPLAYPIGMERTRVSVEGTSAAPGDELPTVRMTSATRGFFDVLEIPLVRGRGFEVGDIAGAAPVILVNAAFARQFFGDQNPLGKRVTFGFLGAPVAREIVGVIGDVRHEELNAQPGPGVFVPHAQVATGAMHFVMRVTGDPATYERQVRKMFAELNGAMPLSEFISMEGLLSQSLRQRRFQLGLLASFSVVALLLSAIGIYGVMSRVMSERTHEIGVRLAIGADRNDVRMMVLRNGGVLAVSGIAIGTVLALLLTRSMAGMLYEITPLDPVTYLVAAGVLLAVGLMASWVPAWRASAVDPVVALRND
jgi:putative ABC transport system permease protein